MHRSVFPPSNFLIRSEWFANVARLVNESKLKITTLSDIFRAFAQSVRDPSVFAFSDVFVKKSVMFDYEDKTWTATVNHQNTLYNGKPVKFINIKLPSDEFVYTNKYVDRDTDELKRTEETEGFVDMLLEFILSLDLKFEVETVRVEYKPLCERLEFYFQNEEADKIVTVQFENRSCDWRHASKPYLSGDALRSRINRIKDKMKQNDVKATNGAQQ